MSKSPYQAFSVRISIDMTLMSPYQNYYVNISIDLFPRSSYQACYVNISLDMTVRIYDIASGEFLQALKQDAEITCLKVGISTASKNVG